MRTLRLAGSDLALLETMLPGDSLPMDAMLTDGDFSSAETMQRIVDLLARNVVALTLLRCSVSDTSVGMLFKVSAVTDVGVFFL
jgi:hypothetical protein